MKSIEATYEAKEFVRDVLIAANLKDGITIPSESIPDETETMFWFIHITQAKAAEKPAYIIYNVDKTEAFKYADGECIARKVTVSMFINSRMRDNQTLLETIEAKFVESGVRSVDLAQPIQYNPTSKLYSFTMTVQLIITDPS